MPSGVPAPGAGKATVCLVASLLAMLPLLACPPAARAEELPASDELMGPPDALLQAGEPGAEGEEPGDAPADRPAGDATADPGESGGPEEEDVDVDIGEPGGEALEIDMEPGEPPPADEGGFFSFLDAPHAAVSSGLNWLTRNMDAFFANEKVFYDATGSYMRFTWDTSWAEGGQLSSVGNLKIKIRLPRTQKKMKLVFASDPVQARDNVDRTVLEQKQRDSGLFAGLQADVGKEEGWRYKPSLHIKLRTPVDYLVRIRASRRFPLEDWSLYVSQSVYWFYSTGGGADTQLEFDHQLDADSLFRAAFFARWSDANDDISLSEVISLTHQLSDRRSLSYQAGIYGTNRPGLHVTDYLLQLRYRQRVHSDYLFMELIPEIRYRKDAGFRAEHSLLVRIEMVFNG